MIDLKSGKKIGRRIERLEQKYARRPQETGSEVDISPGYDIHAYGADPGWKGTKLVLGFEGVETDETLVARVDIPTFLRDAGVVSGDKYWALETIPYNGKVYTTWYGSNPGKILKWSSDLEYIGSCTLSLSKTITDASVRVGNKLYIGSAGCPATVFKIDLDTFTEEGYLTLQASDGNDISVLHSPDGQYLYVGFTFAAEAPYPPDWTTKIVKIRLSDFSRFAVFDSGAAEKDTFHHLSGMHSDGTYLYTCNEPANGGRIARINLSDFTFKDKLTLSGNEQYSRDIIYWDENLYVTTDIGLVKITASTMTRVGRIDSIYQWYCWNATIVGNYLYYTEYGDPYWDDEPDRLHKIDLKTFTLTATLEFSMVDPKDWYVRWVAAM